MVQLFAFDGTTKYELDLYETEPIKINLQIEDIIEIDQVESAYSQRFRIPATQRNSRFFKWWYEMSTVDFDITKVVRGEIHSDGLIYMSGELRLESAFINRETDQVDLEIVFLGNTRDFATQIAEIYMNQLPMQQYNTALDLQVLQDSWDPIAYPDIKAIRYIIADRGLDFDENGEIVGNLGEIVGPQNHTHSIMKNNTSYPLLLQQFTPIISVKAIIDSIFNLTEYDYTDDSFFSHTSTYWPMVQDLYTDGLPSETATIQYINGNITVNQPLQNGADGFETNVPFYDEVSDPSDAWRNDEYTAQTTDNNVDLDIECEFTWQGEFGSNPGPLTVKLYKNNSVIDTVNINAFNNQNTYVYKYNSNPIPPIIPDPQVNMVPGDKFYLTYEVSNADRVAVGSTTSHFIVSGASSIVNAAQLLKDDVLIIDFLKSILKKFRLVMAPAQNEPYKFVIKPWQDYIGSSPSVLDWTHKLDNAKDIKVSPIFFEQTQDILFKDQDDSDQTNDLYQNQNNLVFGELLYDGSNELIVGRREIDTIFAPTPVERVEELSNGSTFVIPKLFVHSDELNADASHDHVQHLPMRPKPRLLFWNGLSNINNGQFWYYGDGITTSIAQTTYPRATYATEIPNTSTTLHLNWNKIDLPTTSNINTLDGQSVYERYWSDYIESLYSKDARKFTAYFVLDSQDLRTITFDKRVFIEGNYYRIAKVYDAPLNNVDSIKVDLIKLLN